MAIAKTETVSTPVIEHNLKHMDCFNEYLQVRERGAIEGGGERAMSIYIICDSLGRLLSQTRSVVYAICYVWPLCSLRMALLFTHVTPL